MSRKRVLLISYYWPPSGGAGVQRWVKFCKYLPEFDIDPVVLTVKNGTYPVLDESLGDDVPDDIEIHRSKSFEPYSIFGKLTGRSDKQVSTPSTAFSMEGGWMQKLGVWIRSNFFIPDARIGWIPATLSKAKAIIQEKNIDTVITTGPPNSTHIIGTKLKKWRPDMKWIMDMRDPWSKILYHERIPRLNIAHKLDEYLERQALKLADNVVVVSNGMANQQKLIVKRKYEVITNGFDHSDFSELSTSVTSDKLVIKYVGGMIEESIPYHFLKAVSSMSAENKAKIDLQFIGVFNNKLRKVIQQNDLQSHISFKDYMPHKQAKKEMQEADILLLVIPNTTNNELILTGKIFDYIAAKKPIFLIGPTDGDAAHIIKSLGIGICYSHKEISRIKADLESALNHETFNYNHWSNNLKYHPYSRYTLAQNYALLCHKKKNIQK